MYLGYQNNKIKYYTEQPLSPTIYNVDRWEYTVDKYILSDDKSEYVLYDEEKELAKAKQSKYDEALSKAYTYQEKGTVIYKNCIFEMSKSNRDNLRDTEEALRLMGKESTEWMDRDDTIIVLTLEEIQYIRLNLILGAIQELWIYTYPYYKQLIENASTIEEVNAIEIVYPRHVEEQQIEESEEN